MTESPSPAEQPEIKPSDAPLPPIETEPDPPDDPPTVDADGLWQTLPLD
jgi:hypothetical protein